MQVEMNTPDAPPSRGEAPLFFAPFVASRQKLQPQWIDANRHLNMAYYHVLFDRALDEVLSLCHLGPDAIEERHSSCFTLDTRVRYRRELTASDQVRVTVQMLDLDDKRMHLWLEARHSIEGWTAASCECLIIHVDMRTRRAAPFPDDALALLQRMQTDHIPLPRPDGVGEGISIRTRRQ